MDLRSRLHKKHAYKDFGNGPSLYGDSGTSLPGGVPASLVSEPEKEFFRINDAMDISSSEHHKREFHAKQGKSKEKDNYTIAKYLNLGYYIVTPLILGICFGLLLDKALGTTYYVKIFLFVGIAGTFYNLVKLVRET